jgi:hypothetical protein
MKKTLSIVAVALMMAGSTAFACSGCGCEAKKSDKDKTECGSSCKGEKKQTACGNTQKGDDGKKTACGGSHKGDDGRKTA